VAVQARALVARRHVGQPVRGFDAENLVDVHGRHCIARPARFYAADFASLKAVRDFADVIARDPPRLDLLVKNAGIAFSSSQPRRRASSMCRRAVPIRLISTM
jgi:NAD(P)-dependent dehydrogenase (short-subunit alcohol dehydrogenase family)